MTPFVVTNVKMKITLRTVGKSFQYYHLQCYYHQLITEKLGHYLIVSKEIIELIFETEDGLGKICRVSGVVYNVPLFWLWFFKDAPYKVFDL